MFKILIVEDDDKLKKYIEEYLIKYDFIVDNVTDFSFVLEKVRESKPNLILLDINLPKFDGFYFLNKIIKGFNIPIIIISARSDEKEQIRAIDMGADDYITKPFSMEFLLAKINAVIRRYQSDNQEIMKCKNLLLNCENMTLEVDDESISLSKNEFKLIKLFVSNYNKVVKREDLLSELWDSENFVYDNTLTVNVTRLKKKMKSINSEVEIVTKRGIGYVLN